MSGRRLKAKPEALEARGFKTAPMNSDGSPPWKVTETQREQAQREHGTGDVQREQSTRVLNASLAVVHLKDAADHATEAHAALVFLGLPSSHHAVISAKRCADEARKAAEHAKLLLKTVMR